MSRDSIRAIVRNADIANRLYLVKNNVPFDVAMSLEDHEVMAYAIIFGTMDGGKWDWDAMQWVKDE